MADYKNHYSSIGTIVLTQNVAEQTYFKARNNNAIVDPYICKKTGNDYQKALKLEIGHGGHMSYFMHIEIKELPNRVSYYLKITINLNNFMFQTYPNLSFVNSKEIIKDIEWIISSYLNFPGFNLDRMSVRSIDIAMDFIVSKDPSNYLKILKHKEIPRYLLQYNNDNSSLSIHSYSSIGSINSVENTPNKGEIYNKSSEMGIEKNILRFEFRLEGDQKNQLLLNNDYEQNNCGRYAHLNGVTKFSEIFCADLGVELNKRFINGFILKDIEAYEAIKSHDDYISNHNYWIDRFEDTDDYYRRLSPLWKERNTINRAISEFCEDYAVKMEGDLDQETQLELWDLIESHLEKEFYFRLSVLETPVELKKLQLRDLFFEMGINALLIGLNIIIPIKGKKGIQAASSTKKLISSFFRKRANEFLSDWKKEEKEDINQQISSLRNDFRTFNKYMFISQLDKDYNGVDGHELFNELKTLANSYDFFPSEKVLNLYKHYTE